MNNSPGAKCNGYLMWGGGCYCPAGFIQHLDLEEYITTFLTFAIDCGFAARQNSNSKRTACVCSLPVSTELSGSSCQRRQCFVLLSRWGGCIIQPERRGLPQWLNIMTCEPIKQLIKNSNEADDDEGEAGENFITIINPLWKKKNNWSCFLGKVIEFERRERRWRDPAVLCYWMWTLLTQLKMLTRMQEGVYE